MYYDSNIYYNPANHDLIVELEHEFSDGCYQFDIRVIWSRKEKNKKVYYTARDAGCSCPSPFENYWKIEDLDKVTPEIAQQLLDEIANDKEQDPNGEYQRALDKLIGKIARRKA